MSLNSHTHNSVHNRSEQQTDNATNGTSDSVALTNHERRTLKGLSPQLIASAVSGLFQLYDGLSLAYLAVISHQIKSSSALFQLTFDQLYWLSYSYWISVSVGRLVCAFFVDKIGRLNSFKLAVVPTLIGWIILAAALNTTMIFAGLVFLGIGVAWGTCADRVYVTEIAHPDIRGSLLSISSCYELLGIIAFFYTSDYIGWRILAVIAILFLIIVSPTIILLPESPIWLITKERNVQAKKSLDWFDKHQPVVSNTTFTQHHFELLAKEDTSPPTTKHFLQLFYKPFLILAGLLIFQQLSGFNVFQHYLTTDFKRFDREIGYDTFIYVRLGLQVAAPVANLFLFLLFRRRTLLISGSVAMALCLLVHGFYVTIIEDGSNSSWISTAAVFLYMAFSYVSVGAVPDTMMAELFAHKIRGVGTCVVYALPNLLMLSVSLIYPYLGTLILPGIFEWTFIVLLLIGAVYTFIFLPETHKLDLASIQQCFNSNKVYIKWFWARNRNSRRESVEIAMTHV